MLNRPLLLLLLLPALLRAQPVQRSPVVDLLDRITADINDLRYADAIARGRPMVARAGDLPTASRTRLHLLMAAAFFPEDGTLQAGDSALHYLRAVLRDAPDAAYPPELRWRGLDTLLAAARASTAAAVLRTAARQPIGGPGAEARLGIVATPGTTVVLRVLRRPSGEVAHVDSLTGEQGEFLLRAHDGMAIDLAPGEYELVLDAVQGAARDRRTYAATIEAPALALEVEPSPEGLVLLPESARPDRTRLLRVGLLAGGATAALGFVGRRDRDLRDAFGADPRAVAVGGAIAATVAWFARAERDVPIPANIAANAAARAAVERARVAVRERNALRLAQHVGSLLVQSDAR